jgi:hypothetical protein
LKDRQFTRDAYESEVFKMLEYLAKKTQALGVQVELAIALGKHSTSLPIHTISIVRCTKAYMKPVSLEVCRALNLLTEHEESIEISFRRHKISIPHGFENLLRVKALYPSNLGIEFLAACRPRSRKYQSDRSMTGRSR